MQKEQTLNCIELENRLLEMDAAGISSVRVIVELNKDLANTLTENLNERLESDSDEEVEEDELNYGNFFREVKKSNPREMIGMLKYQKRQIQQLEQKYSGKIVLSSNGIKFYAHQPAFLNELQTAFFEEIFSKIRSYNIDKNGKQLYFSQRATEQLAQIKIVRYNNDKYCYYFSINEIEEDMAIARIKQVQNQYERLFVPFLGGKPRGPHARKAFKKVLEIKTRKLISENKEDKTEISTQGDGFILQEKDLSYLNSIKEAYSLQLESECLLFMCLINNIPNIEMRLTKLSKVGKYLHVAFTNIVSYITGKEPKQILSMFIKVVDLKDILGTQKFRKIFGSFLNQLFTINEGSAFQIGFFFPFQNQHHQDLAKKFQKQLQENFVPAKVQKMEGVNFYTPKIVDDNIVETYLTIFDASVKRKMKCKQMRSKEKQLTNYVDPNQSKSRIFSDSTFLDQSNLNNTTILYDQDQSILSTQPINTTIVQINHPVMSIYVTQDMVLEQPTYEKMQSHYKRDKKDREVQRILLERTGQYYKVFKIIVNENRKIETDNKQFVSCILRLDDFKSGNGYFSKIKLGKKVEKGLLVQLAVENDNIEERQEAYRAKNGYQACYYMTHQIQLL